MKEHALQYLKEGKPIFPVGPDKKPLVPWKPYQENLPSEAQVVKWWEKWPDANIAMATGKLSGVIVIDADSQESATRLANEHPEVRKTKFVKTGRGWHIYFQYQDGIRNSAGKFAPGLDIRGEGGYVLLPPSKHETGAVYQWMNYNILPLPEALAEKLLNGDPVYKGQRNDVLFRYGAGLRAKGKEEDEILQALMAENDRRCRPPLLEREVQSITKSITRYPPGTRLEDIRSSLLQDIEPTSFFEPKNTEPQRWIWNQCLALGTFNIIAGKPGLGKTTFAANLSIAVARGVPFLGRQTTQGKVLYMFLDGPEAELFEVFEKFHIRESDPILKVCCKTNDMMQWLDRQIAKHSFKLIVIDTFAKHKGGDINKDVEKYLSDISQLAVMHHICFLFNHHIGRQDTLMGNTMIEGSARTILTIRNKAHARVFETHKQNAGISFEPYSLVGLSEGWLNLGYCHTPRLTPEDTPEDTPKDTPRQKNDTPEGPPEQERVSPSYSPHPKELILREEEENGKCSTQSDPLVDTGRNPPSQENPIGSQSMGSGITGDPALKRGVTKSPHINPTQDATSEWRRELDKKWKNFLKK